MNLSIRQLTRLNELLKSSDLDLPEFRRTVGQSSSNFFWLQRNLMIRNSKVASEELKALLGIKGVKIAQSVDTQLSGK